MIAAATRRVAARAGRAGETGGAVRVSLRLPPRLEGEVVDPAGEAAPVVGEGVDVALVGDQ